jgi:hypothetical protein
MAAALEAALDVRVVEELAVEDGLDGPVFIADRLMAIREPDDRQPAAGERDARLLERPLAVGPAMNQRVAHAAQARDRNRVTSRQIHDACDTAHDPSLK